MEKLRFKSGQTLLFGILFLAMALFGSITGYARTADTIIIPADVSVPSEGCVFVGIEGDYVADSQAALQRINEIRLEACEQGVPNPNNPSEKLTMEDYVPIKWSSELETVARLRAAEASRIIGHTRPNGYSCFSVSPKSIRNSGEVLAWNWSTSMVNGVNQWYGEKSAWVNQDSSQVTGHYTQMIDPENTYVGLGCMVTDQGLYFNTTCGRFSRSPEETDTTMAHPVENCVQIIEIQKSALIGTSLTQVEGDSVDGLEAGDTVSYELMFDTNLEGYRAKALVMDGITWTSSDTNVAVVDAYGRVTGTGAGPVIISAASGSGLTAAVSLQFYIISVNLDKTELSIKKGKTEKLAAIINPSNATNKNVIWSSSDTNVAAVSSDGTVTAKDYGTAIITAMAADGSGKSAKCKVTVPYEIKYKLNGGTNNSQNPYMYYRSNIRLEKPVRKGYLFKGWYTDKKFKNKITKIKKSTAEKLTLYAKWEKVKVDKPSILSLRNKAKRKAVVKFSKVCGADGYEICYGRNREFKKKFETVTTEKLYTVLKRLMKGKTYYVKVRAFKMDSAENRVYSKYSEVGFIEIKK